MNQVEKIVEQISTAIRESLEQKQASATPRQVLSAFFGLQGMELRDDNCLYVRGEMVAKDVTNIQYDGVNMSYSFTPLVTFQMVTGQYNFKQEEKPLYVDGDGNIYEG
jgi:hypothetical protein